MANVPDKYVSLFLRWQITRKRNGNSKCCNTLWDKKPGVVWLKVKEVCSHTPLIEHGDCHKQRQGLGFS